MALSLGLAAPMLIALPFAAQLLRGGPPRV
jgi:hypothetical protein